MCHCVKIFLQGFEPPDQRFSGFSKDSLQSDFFKVDFFNCSLSHWRETGAMALSAQAHVSES